MCWCCVYEKICQRQATYILDFATLHVYELVGVERVGVVSTRKYAKRLTFWTLQHFMSMSSLALNMLAFCLRENTPSDIHFGLCYTSCLRDCWRSRIIVKHFSFVRVGIVFADNSKTSPPPSRRPLFALFYFQVRKRPKTPSFACHAANYNNSSCN